MQFSATPQPIKWQEAQPLLKLGLRQSRYLKWIGTIAPVGMRY